METQGVFKSNVFGGFNKRDVLVYLDEMYQKAKSTEEELDKKIESLEKSNEELSASVTEFKDKVSKLQDDYESSKQKNSDLEFIIQDLKDEIDLQKRIVDSKDREISLHMESNRQLRMKNEVLLKKNKKLEQIEFQIADTLLEAKQTAFDIIDTAKQKAGGMNDASIAAVREIKESISGFKNEISVLKSAFNDFSTSFNKQLDNLQSVTEKAEKKLTVEPKEKSIDVCESAQADTEKTSETEKASEEKKPKEIFAFAKPVKVFLAEKNKKTEEQADSDKKSEGFSFATKKDEKKPFEDFFRNAANK